LVQSCSGAFQDACASNDKKGEQAERMGEQTKQPELLSAFREAILLVFKAMKKSFRECLISVYSNKKFNMSVH